MSATAPQEPFRGTRGRARPRSAGGAWRVSGSRSMRAASTSCTRVRHRQRPRAPRRAPQRRATSSSRKSGLPSAWDEDAARSPARRASGAPAAVERTTPQAVVGRQERPARAGCACEPSIQRRAVARPVGRNTRSSGAPAARSARLASVLLRKRGRSSAGPRRRGRADGDGCRAAHICRRRVEACAALTSPPGAGARALIGSPRAPRAGWSRCAARSRRRRCRASRSAGARPWSRRRARRVSASAMPQMLRGMIRSTGR